MESYGAQNEVDEWDEEGEFSTTELPWFATSEMDFELSTPSSGLKSPLPSPAQEEVKEEDKTDGEQSAEAEAEGEGYFYGHYTTGEVGEWSPPESEEREIIETPPKTQIPWQEKAGEKNLLVHASPVHFPDIRKARKSVFGSIFMRTTAQITEGLSMMKSVGDSNYNLVQSMLNSFEKILPTLPSESDRKQLMLMYQESLLKVLEEHGITKLDSDGNLSWDIYPMTQNHLFSIQIDDRIHQTRDLSKIEDRIVHGSEQNLRGPYRWATGSVWTGHWDEIGMSGPGTYIMPHGVVYEGKMKDGVFHDDDATLIYPNMFKALHCVFDMGKMINCQFQFPDELLHDQKDWKYCKYPDRRFFSEVKNGLKPAKLAQKTQIDPPRKILPDCYDTGDGFYCPKARTITTHCGFLLRVPLPKEEEWIKKHCRKANPEQLDFRPDFYEDWFDDDTDFINKILRMQEMYRTNKISYDELQQFYADYDLIPSYKKKKNQGQLDLEEYLKSIPDPVALRDFRDVKKHRHRMHRKVVVPTNKDFKTRPSLVQTPSRGGISWKSKISLSRDYASFIAAKESKMSKIKIPSSQGHLPSTSTSKFNLKTSAEVSKKSSIWTNKMYSAPSSVQVSFRPNHKREIPEKFLEYRQVLRAPFDKKRKPHIDSSGSSRGMRRCSSTSSELSNWDLDSVKSDRKFQTTKKDVESYIRGIIMEAASVGPTLEVKRLKKRLMWAEKVTPKSTQLRANKAQMKFLEEIFESIPDKVEFCDSDPSKTCDLKELAIDKYQVLKYWGERKFLLDLKI